MIQNWPFFQLFFFWQYRPGKCVLRYCRTKKRLSILLKGLTHGFGPKMALFPTFFLCNIGQENVFYDILEGKNAFVAYKNKKFKKSKNWHFPKGVNPWFWVQKWPFFQLFFFFGGGNNRPGKCLLRYCTSKKRLTSL